MLNKRQTTTVRSPSENGSDDDEDGEPTAGGISRTRLRIDQARSRFMPSVVDARDVDFSDRVNGKRKSYKASSRRRRVLEDGTEEYGEQTDIDEDDDGDDDGSEGLTRKLARLRRELEEAKEELGKQQKAGGTAPKDEAQLASLSQALDEMAKSSEAATLPLRAAYRPPAQEQAQAADDAATYTITYAPNYEQTHALAKAADFDRRLVMLERALGIGSSAMPELEANGLPRAVLPTLSALQKQISTLSDASTSSLDTISRRVRTLTQEAESLEKARRNAKAAQEALASTGIATPAGAAPDMASEEDSEQVAKINALYGTIPTIENLAPLLPPLLDRLRSLRVLHSEAAAAAETLDRLEKKQADMSADIKQWREGLEKVEAAMGKSETAMTGNMKVVEGWMKELEARVNKLS
jgi:nuclear migration protein JNM1